MKSEGKDTPQLSNNSWDLDLKKRLPAESKFILTVSFQENLNSNSNPYELIILASLSYGKISLFKFSFNLENSKHDVKAVSQFFADAEYAHRRDKVISICLGQKLYAYLHK